MVNQSQGIGQSVLIDTVQSRMIRMKKGVMTTARLVNDRLLGLRWVPIMVTLTYEKGDDWAPEHIADFMRRVQMWARRKGQVLPYVWVAELQKRGAVHYHVLLWMPSRWRIPRSDRRGWWPHGMTNTIRVKNAVGYVAKYASKFESKDAKFPRGARIHGIGGLLAVERRIVSWWKLPKDLREGAEGSCRWVRAAGGGWLNPDTGEVKQSDWGLCAVSPGYVGLVRKPSGVCRVDRPEQRALIAERVADLAWRVDLNRSELLADQREKDLYSYWRFFEAVEAVSDVGEATHRGSIRPVPEVITLRGPLPLSTWHEGRAIA